MQRFLRADVKANAAGATGRGIAAIPQAASMRLPRMSVTASPPASAPATGRAAKFIFFTVLACMAFVQVFVTFRGLASPAGMEYAQLARELAAGNGLHTNVVRPYAWRQMIASGHDGPLAQMPETTQPPLPALVLAPVFKLLPRHWDYTGESRIYLLDRVVASVSLFFLFGTIGVSWFTARRVFDERIAGWMAVALLFSQPFWDVMRSGPAPMMALFFFSIALHRFTAALESQEDEGTARVGQALGAGIALALLALTHDMAPWLIAGLAVAWVAKIKPRRLVFVLLFPPVIALGAWAARNAGVCGEPLGTGKAVLQAALSFPQDSWLLRDFSGNAPDVDFPLVLRKMLGNVIAQLRSLPEHLGCLVPAALFFVSLLHPFRRPETGRMRSALAIVWIFAVAGMALISLPGGAQDDRQLHFLFLPLFTAFGFAFLAVLWTRLVPLRPLQGWWSKNGAAAIAVAISALPMMQSLPIEAMIGLSASDRFAHWPPYLPDRIAKLRTLTKPGEVIFTDAPWAIAWYAGRPAVWLPVKAEQLGEMRAQLQKHGESAAGMVITPLSAKCEVPADVFRGEYRDWATQIFRGYGTAFGVDTITGHPDFPFREFYPLVGQPIGDRFIAEMVFMADRKRW